MKYLEAERLIRVVDDESEGFLSAGLSGGAPAGEALYEVTVLSRYFLRLFARNLRSYHDVMLLGETGEEGLDVRRRVYRQLLLAPVFYRTAATEEEFSYLRHQHREIDAKCQQWFGLSLELYDDAAMLVCEEPPSLFAELYPSARRALHDIMLQFAAAWRARGDAAAHRDATRTVRTGRRSTARWRRRRFSPRCCRSSSTGAWPRSARMVFIACCRRSGGWWDGMRKRGKHRERESLAGASGGNPELLVL